MSDDNREDRIMRGLPTDHMTEDEVAAVRSIISKAHARIDAAVAEKRALWEALRAKNGGGIYRKVSSYTGKVQQKRAVAVVRCTKTLIICVRAPQGLYDSPELRFSAATGRLKRKRHSIMDPEYRLVLHSASARVKTAVAATADQDGAFLNLDWREHVAALPTPGNCG